MNFPKGLSGLATKIRILPLVLAVGTIVLVLKGNDVVVAATEEIGRAAAGSETHSRPDFALDESEETSPAEVDILTSLSKRRQELDSRGADMTTRQNVLAATEKRVDEKIAQLKDLEDQIGKLLAKRDAEQQKQVDALVKLYAAMKPANAARIFNNLSEDVLIAVAGQMKADALAPILSAMQPDAAQKLTVKLASKLALPEKAQADPAPAPVMDRQSLLPSAMPQQNDEIENAEQQAALAPQAAPPAAVAPVHAPAAPIAAPPPAKAVAPKAAAPKPAARKPAPAAETQTAPAAQKSASAMPAPAAGNESKPAAQTEAAPAAQAAAAPASKAPAAH